MASGCETSLDELPELLNVLRGDISLVGPRPLLAQYLPLYSTHHRRRHEIRPGITGLAQISGRNALTWPRRFDLDVQNSSRHRWCSTFGFSRKRFVNSQPGAE